MRKDTTICIGTVGYPTFNKCYSIAKKLMSKDPRIKDIVVIKDKYPTSAWLNEMRVSCDTTWCLQVDEDMYLNKNALDELLKLAKRSEAKGVSILNASSLLYDIFLRTNIGSLKLWNTKVFKVAEFKDVSGSDRQFAKDAQKFGFKNVEVSKVLGMHDSAPTPEIAYFKYKEYVMKIKKFKNEKSVKKFLAWFKPICDKNNTIIGKFAYEGALAGEAALLDNKTKNYLKNINSNEIKPLYKKYSIKQRL